MADRDSPEARYARIVADRLREGRGKGTGADYRPWLTVRTKRLNSNTWRPCGKNGRTYHLLSNIEFAVFSILDRQDVTTDIREQFPLLPLSETQRIAAEMGRAHPRACPFRDKGDAKVDIVMTTDLLVDLADRPGLPANVAVSVKPAADLEDTPTKVRNLLAKAEIERRYWAARDTPFLLITDADLPDVVRENADLLQRYMDLKGIELPASLAQLAEHLLDRIIAAPGLPVRDHGTAFDKAMGLPRGTGTNIIWHSLATSRWTADPAERLDAARPLFAAAPNAVFRGDD
jgi:hypothetical protein